MVPWNEVAILAGLFVGVSAAAWMLRHDPARGVWVWAFCALLAGGISYTLGERLPFIVGPALGASTLFPVLLLVGALRAARLEVPRWLVPAGVALGLARAALYLADLHVGPALLALAAEPAAALAAAVVYQRRAVPLRSSPVARLIPLALLMVAAVETWDNLGDLDLGATNAPFLAWILVGSVLAAALVIFVIDEERRAEARTQNLERLGLLAGGIAHDFNNLLVGILGNAELLLERIQREPATRRLAEDIVQAADRAAELTQQLLAYAGKAVVFPQTVDVRELTRETGRVPGGLDSRP